MKKIVLIALILCIVWAPAYSQELLPQDQEIIFYTFNGQWEKADSLLDAQIRLQPENPKYYYLKCPFYFYTRYFTNGALNGDSLMLLLVDYANKTIELAEKQAESVENKFYMGAAYGYLSRHYIRQGDMWDAYWAARSARNNLEDVVEEDSEYHDAWLGIAVEEYFTATRLTGLYNTLAWFLGMSGDKDLALNYFQLVAEKGKLCKTEAQFVLALLYRYFENDYDTALLYASSLLKEFPDNQFMHNQMNEIRVFKLIVQRGSEFLLAEADSLEEKYNIANSFVLNRIGYNFLTQNNFEMAISVFKVNLELFPDVANCYDSLAEGYMVSGNNEMAIKFYKLAYEKLPHDDSITDEFRQRLKEGIEEKLDELDADLNI
jgi:tetratricopeptide (TPR) repeat protein